MKIRLIHFTGAAVLAIAGLATACGTSAAKSPSAAGTTPPIVSAPTGANAHDAWQRFAACMSKRVGLQVTLMPPPHYGIRIAGPRNATPATPAQQAAFETKTRAANAYCHHFLASIQKSSNSSQDEAKFRDAMLRFVRCIRSRGINVGDPIITKVVGGFDVSWPRASQTLLGTARGNRAQTFCHSLNPFK